MTVSAWQSMRVRWSATPAADDSWSMIPHGTPEARCSARWHSWASANGGPSKPRARATATSSAADDDRPAPTGTSVSTVPVKPVAGPISATTPAT